MALAEFLHLLIEALADSDMFSGPDGHLNLALSASGLCNCILNRDIMDIFLFALCNIRPHARNRIRVNFRSYPTYFRILKKYDEKI